MKLKKYLDHFLTQKHDLQNKHDWGWTNHVYSCLINGNTYYVRIKKSELNPYEPLLFSHFFSFPHYYNSISHHIITPALETAEHIEINDWYFKSLLSFINDLQQNSIVNLIAEKRYFNYLQYIDVVPDSLYKEMFLTFYSLLSQEAEIVLCHNDLSIFNILVNETTNLFQIIDFELASFGFAHYDIFNFIRSIPSLQQQEFYIKKISSQLQIDLTLCYKYMFFVNYFAYTWAFYQTNILFKNFIATYINQTEAHFYYWWKKIFQ
ncbi:aminoglycoside phosphotransferase family protein [Ureaplasma zalophigenitalium]|uniref:Aminoglycoside phosphotransferase family protein n=1 Tax=Ureaplasma zalophigenitalium TaxID=907723 RepID=A0ABT3BPL8_9BACT|nr:aminoglycoside phosphotransferase family protein [Ureaplasma zalophigenitalium]MCV3754195.1 aminoglycoside phosphotransferase family protein [Ureaplasma zalophigenitalium]